MIYLDTSCLLKLLLEESESHAVREAVAREPEVIVSSLAELETVVSLKAGWLGGNYGERRYRAYLRQIDEFRALDPFRFVPLPGRVFDTAIRQQRAPRAAQCRSLDRLHLAAMEELGVRRLATNDDAQSMGAKALGFDVVTPGR